MKEKSIVKTFLRGSAISFIGVFIMGIFNYLIRQNLEKNLTQIEYGFLYSVLGFMGIFLAFLDLGLGQTTTVLISKHLSKSDKNKVQSIFSMIFYLKLILSFICFFILYLLTSFLLNSYFQYTEGESIFFILIFLIPLRCFEGLIRTTFNAYKAFAIKKTFSSSKIILTYLLIYLFLNNTGLIVVAYSFIIASVLSVLAGKLWLKYKYKLILFSKPNIKNNLNEVFNFSKWVAISVAGLSIMTQMDTLMLTYLSNLNSVATYNIALPISQIFQSLFIFATVFTPFASSMWQKKEIDELKNFTYNALFCFLWLVFPVLISLIFLSEDIISLLFSGDEYTIRAKYTLIILGSGIPLFAIAQFYINTLTAMECCKNVTIIVILGVITNVLLNYLLIPYFNIEGAAFATIGAYLIIAILAVRSFNKQTNFKLPLNKILPIILLGCIFSIIAYFIGEQSNLRLNIIYTTIIILTYIISSLYFSMPIINKIICIIKRKR